jgi:hypothetical protein
MAGQGTGKGEVNDKHLEILHRIERAQSAEVRIAARREKNDLIWRNACGQSHSSVGRGGVRKQA